MKVRPAIWSLLFLVCVSLRPSVAQPPLYHEQSQRFGINRAQPPELSGGNLLADLGYWGWGGSYRGAAMGRYLVMVASPTLLIVDMIDPVHPKVLWEYLAGSVFDIEVKDSLAYVTLPAKLLIIDLHNPSSPEILAGLHIPSILGQTRVENGIAYVTTRANKVWIVDVSNPRAPFIRSSIVTILHSPSSSIRNQRLYIGDQSGVGLDILDARNPDSLRIRTISPPVGHVFSTAIRDTVLFMGYQLQNSAYGYSLLVYSIADPDTPKQIGGLKLGSGRNSETIYSISISGNRAYLTTLDSGLYVLDIQNPRSPYITLHQKKSTPPFVTLQDVVCSDSLLFFSRHTDVATYRLVTPDSIDLVSVFPTGDVNMRVATQGQTGFVASGFAGLWTIDLSDESQPRRLGNVRNHGYAYDLVVDSQYVYLATGDLYGYLYGVPDSLREMIVINVSDPGSPQIVGRCQVDDPYAIAKSGDLVFVVSKRETTPDTILTIIDVHEPSNPVVVNTITGTYEAWELASKDSIVYLASRDGGLKIIDCRNPLDPIVRATFLSRVGGVVVDDSLAYVDTIDSLYVVNVADPTTPMVLGSLRKRFTCCNEVDMVKVGTLIGWTTYANTGLIDVSDPSQPFEVDAFRNIFSSGGITMYGDTVLLIEGSGIRIARWDTSTTGVRELQGYPTRAGAFLDQNFPNPFNAATQIVFYLPTRSMVTLEVFNVLGERIGTLVDENLDAGRHLISFNGSSYASGVYLVRLNTDESISTQRIILIR